MTMIAFVVHFSSCHTGKTASEYPFADEEWLAFGSGGGFTGVETRYVLHSGEIWGSDMEGKEVRLRKVSSEVWSQVFSNAKTIGLYELKCAVPGNTYDFIEYKRDGQVVRVVWDDQHKPSISENVLIFHRRLMYLIRREDS